MEQQIMVYDINNNLVGTTFNRRAKQLVTKQRARWIDETHTAVCLLPEQKEEPKIDNEFANRTYEIEETCKTGELFNNECLLCLAKKRVRETRNLIIHSVVYVFASIFLLLLLWSNLNGFESGLIIGIICTWGAFLTLEICMYVYQRLKRTNLFSSFSRDPVQTEYMKLKAMTSAKIAEEYKRL